MTAGVHLDTHVVVWLYAGALEQIPRGVRARLEAEPLLVSPVVSLEVDFLREIGRVREGGAAMLDDLRRRVGLRLVTTPLDAVVAEAAKLAWTRDPFDRLIVATAVHDGATLLTRDRLIRRHCRLAKWG